MNAAAAARAAAALEGAPAEQIVAWALATFGADICLACSMQDGVLVDLVSRLRPGITVLFLDTGYHFPQTLCTRDLLAARYPIELRTLIPEASVAAQDAAYGPALHARDPDQCCALRKVAPLDAGLAGFAAWFTGLRRAEAPTRRQVPVVDWDARRSKVKVNPLANWSAEDVAGYLAAHDVPVNPLLQAGFPSIGCAPCTRPVAPGEHPRAGRWAGLGKTECGLHA